MRVSEVRKKHPEFFAIIETAVWDDCINSKEAFNHRVVRRIAYNAAAVATFELHKILTQNKKEAMKYNRDYIASLRGVITPWLTAHGFKPSAHSVNWLLSRIKYKIRSYYEIKK